MGTLNLEKISGLTKSPSGIWCSDLQQEVSFPSDGNVSRQSVESQSFWYEHRNKCITSLLKKYSPRGPIVDIGGGNGAVSVALQDAGFDAVLLEPEMAGVKEAKNRGVSTVICSTFDLADFESRSLPAVGMFDVLEHIENHHEFLKKIHGALADDGRLYLTVPAFKILWSEADVNAGHFRRYTRSSLISVLRDAGFKVTYVSYFFSLLVMPIMIFRSLPNLFSYRRLDPNWRHAHHQSKRGLLGSILLMASRWEYLLMRRGISIPVGSSCIVVAEKI